MSKNLILFDMGPLAKSLDSITTNVANMDKKIASIEASKTADNVNFEKFKTSQNSKFD
jgi:hypothetical protein